MAVQWFKTNFLGVRFREHATRKHGVRFDRCFSIRYKVGGKDKEEAVGWTSEGVTAESAFKVLTTIRDNIRLGAGPQSLAAMRDANQAAEEAHRAAEEEKAMARQQEIKAAITVADFWESTYFPIAEATKAQKTFLTEKSRFHKWIAPAIGDIPLRKLTATQIKTLCIHVQKSGRSAATARYVMADISQLWNTAEAHGLVEGAYPGRRVKKPREDNRRTRFLTEEEARRLLDALKARSKDTHDEALLSLFTGMRAGEVYSLAWGDVDLENGTLHIRDTKSKRDRHAFISAEVRTMLEGRYQGQAKTMHVFPATGGNRRQWVSDTFNRVVDDLGLNDTGEFIANTDGEQIPVKIRDARQRVVFHSLRHTFASWLALRGTPLHTLKDLLGHSTIAMTERYAHLLPDSLRKAAMNLQGILKPKPAKVIELRKVKAA